ncbi:MAG: hypothetical protein E7657_06755 [Ruminococcaceae bacterium]|nr:hypothetical protein [Oscillospiraceae bacterium]
MNRIKHLKRILSSFFAGILNGFLGTGGGVALYFALSKEGADKRAYATASVGVLLLSLQTVFLYRSAAASPEEISPFLPFLAVAGGALGTFLLGKVNSFTLRLIFALLLLGSGGYTIGKEIYYALA